MALQPELAILVTEIEANVSHVDSITHGLNDAQFNWRPAPDTWSIAECMAHLLKINGPDLMPMRQAIETARTAGKTGEGPFEYDFLSRKFVASMEPPVTKKFKAPEVYVPPPDSPLVATIGEYKRIAVEFRRLVESSNGLDLRKAKTMLPALPAWLRGIIKMPLGARFQLLTTHDRRHLWQAEQVRNHPDFPKT